MSSKDKILATCLKQERYRIYECLHQFELLKRALKCHLGLCKGKRQNVSNRVL